MTAVNALTVIIPHYGDPAHAATVVQALAAQQDPPDFEVVIVDDASPDPYPDDPRVKLLRRERNGGFGSAVNTGAEVARHPFLLILNSDVTIGQTFLRDLCREASSWMPAVVAPMVIGASGEFQWTGRRFPRLSYQVVEWLTCLARFNGTRWKHAAVGHDLSCVGGAVTPVDWLVGVALLLPAEEFRAVGGFDESFHMNCEEIDLQRRLRRHGIPSIFVGTLEIGHLGGASSGGSDRRRAMLVRSRIQYAAKWRENPMALRVFLTMASLINLAVNAVRCLWGRDVRPLSVFRREFALLWKSQGGKRQHDPFLSA